MMEVPPQNTPSPVRRRLWRKQLWFGLSAVVVLGGLSLFAPRWIFDVVSDRRLESTIIDRAWGGGRHDTIVWENGLVLETGNGGWPLSLRRLSTVTMQTLDDRAVEFQNFLTTECTQRPSGTVNVNGQPVTFEIVGPCIDCSEITFRYQSAQVELTTSGDSELCWGAERERLSTLLNLVEKGSSASE